VASVTASWLGLSAMRIDGLDGDPVGARERILHRPGPALSKIIFGAFQHVQQQLTRASRRLSSRLRR